MEQARLFEGDAPMYDEKLKQELIRLRDDEGITFTALSAKTGVNRTKVSQYVNKGARLNEQEMQKLWDEIQAIGAAEAALDASAMEAPAKYRDSIGLYQTAEFREAVGWCSYVRAKRKMGVLVGHPGCGKTTILRYFAEKTPGVAYIEAWPNMRMGDLLGVLARAAGVALSGNNYQKTQDIIAALSARDDITIAVDEAEYLAKWDVDKFEILRKIWDNTGTPIILCGTHELETKLTRGTGNRNLAQLYRRKIEIKLKGISASEARDILKEYNVTPDVAEALAAVASESKRGGMGTFVELLDLCLETAEGGQINTEIFQGAKRYKLMR